MHHDDVEPGTAPVLQPTRDPAVALERLRQGNDRYVEGRELRFRPDAARRLELARGQAPIATVFACVDSRAPVERVFDQGHGEVLVIRTAAHVLDEAALGSVEFGVAVLNTPLVVVLGHEQCGAVDAAIGHADAGTEAPGSIQAVVAGLRPAVDSARGQEGDRRENTTRQHSRMIAERLAASPLIGPRLAGPTPSVRIVPAYYEIRTGRVEFLG